MKNFKVTHTILLFLGMVLVFLTLSNCTSTTIIPTAQPNERPTHTASPPAPTTPPEPTPTRTPDLTRPDTLRPTHAVEATQRAKLPTATPISLGAPVSENALQVISLEIGS